MSTVVALRAHDRFIVGHDSLLMEKERGQPPWYGPRPGIEKLVVWPEFAVCYTGSTEIPDQINRLPRVRSVEEAQHRWQKAFLSWDAAYAWMKGNMLLLFPDGRAYAMDPHITRWGEVRGSIA